MSDLTDFFAKKDRKKKKATTRTALTSILPEGKKDEAEEEAAPPPPPPPKQDDGWIEIEDPRGAQVNTGGRRVQEFKRGVEDKEHNGDGNLPVEKFSGWGSKTRAQPAEGSGDTEDTVAQAPSSAFPTLADAANAPQIPASRTKSSPSSAGTTLPSSQRRPRFINSDKEKLRKKLAERDATAK